MWCEVSRRDKPLCNAIAVAGVRDRQRARAGKKDRKLSRGCVVHECSLYRAMGISRPLGQARSGSAGRQPAVRPARSRWPGLDPRSGRPGRPGSTEEPEEHRSHTHHRISRTITGTTGTAQRTRVEPHQVVFNEPVVCACRALSYTVFDIMDGCRMARNHKNNKNDTNFLYFCFRFIFCQHIIAVYASSWDLQTQHNKIILFLRLRENSFKRTSIFCSTFFRIFH